MIKEAISNSNFWLGLCVAGLAFMMLYPTIEFNTNCPDAASDPDGNELCYILKDTLWQMVFYLSLGLDGDGGAFSESLDEKHGRNMIPLMTLMIIILFYQKSKRTAIVKPRPIKQ